MSKGDQKHENRSPDIPRSFSHHHNHFMEILMSNRKPYNPNKRLPLRLVVNHGLMPIVRTRIIVLLAINNNLGARENLCARFVVITHSVTFRFPLSVISDLLQTT